MVETLLLFGVEKLWDLLVRESGRFQGVEDQINELKRDLNMLKCFVEDADAKKHTIAMVRSCIKEIKEIVYDAEDIIETFLWREEYGKTNGFRNRVKYGKTNGFRNRVRRLSCGIVEQKGLVWDIEAISKRISKVIRNMQSLGVQQVIVNDMHMQIQQEKQREIRKTFSNENESILVGLEENIAKLVSYLVMEDSSQVVSVTGMGGIGKTTLARQVFNHETIKNRFNGLAWVCVSQQFSRKYVWQTILRKLQNDYIEPEISEDELQEKLFHVLETQKALIVLDDIWKEEDWDRIKQIFPQKTGWKVLLTSRNEGVALQADPTCFTFKPDCLTLEESWSVFRRIAFPKENTLECKVDEEMEQMGKQMIKQCGGLPLAVRVLGGLLAAKYTLQDWKRVCENLGSHLMGRSNFNDENNDSLNYVLSLSFEELPSYLKHCFLYLAHFPEDYQINVGKLSHYWAAEGILNPMCENGEVVRDVGHCYIEELVKRNMVISERDFRTSKFETCHLHDMMREICLFKAKEENFIQDDDLRSTTPRSQSRRFVSQYPKTLNVERDINSRKLRSLLIVLDDSGKSCTLNGLSFTMLRLLRVLDLSSTRLQGRKLPSSIGKLIHLRYLSLEFAMVFHIPSSLQNLKLLIYLNLDVAARSIFVPNILMGMKDLRYLALPEYMDENTKLELRNQVKLESLINFSTKNNTLEDINGMKRLRTLTISLTEEASLETLFASMTELSSLETLVISSTSYRDHGFVGRIKNGLFLNMIHLKYLSLRRIYMTRLPHEQFLPTHLTCLDLCECRLKEDPMPILEKLLHLTDVNLLNKAFCGKVIVCSSGGFPLLKKISFVGLNEWEEWIVEEGSMPLLHTLKIQNCKGLKELPHGLPFLYSLRDLSVHLMGEKWEEKLWKEGEDYYKVQHIPFVTFG